MFFKISSRYFHKHFISVGFVYYMFPVHEYSQILSFIYTKHTCVFSIVKVSFQVNDIVLKFVSVRQKFH